MKTLYSFAIALCISLTSFAQLSLSVGGKGLDENRYEGIEKNPYLFAEFVAAKAYDKKADQTHDYVLNYNGYTGEFEFEHNGSTYELDVADYDVITVASYTPNKDYSSKFSSEGELKFVKGVDPKFTKKFQMVLYADAKTSVFKSFRVKLAERESVQNGAQVVTTKFFSTFMDYYKTENGKKNTIKLNKKSILSAFPNQDVATYAKKNKLKLNNENDLKQLLSYYSDATVVDAKSGVASNN